MIRDGPGRLAHVLLNGVMSVEELFERRMMRDELGIVH